jgi:hypothetical protein
MASAAKKCPRLFQFGPSAGPIPGQLGGGELAQLLVHQREEVGGVAVSGRSGIEEAGHIGHSAECNGSGWTGNVKSDLGLQTDPQPAPVRHP